jgi:tRNA A37 N6-isopentenylltransferase MiaA
VLDGELSAAEAIERTVIRTRQYAKRQRTYIRGRGWPVYTPATLGAWLDSLQSG